ncbi:Hypp568 [Branchiostoma lanceolatum]|uniref:Hypp568 protein n=1 Tax=Branchiostoma lanceolatum TaxID=7740 RepID=A0A8J9VN26_BRALA|nr:Hypp568 [Branchiostoma lanceolatum]
MGQSEAMGYGNARDTLVMYASNEPRERDTLNAYMSAFQIVGVILSALIQQGTFALFHADLGYNPCSNGTNNSTDHGPSRDTEESLVDATHHGRRVLVRDRQRAACFRSRSGDNVRDQNACPQ